MITEQSNAIVIEGGLWEKGIYKSNDSDHYLITIITVVFNNVSKIEETILSVTTQLNANFEYLILDGGSTDGTLDILRKYDSVLDYWRSEPDKGIYDAMNKGIDLARGRWINFMNSGDRFASNRILEIFNEPIPPADILYGDAIVEYDGFMGPFETHPLHMMWKYSPFCHQASFVSSGLMKEFKFQTKYVIGADHDFFFRAYKAQKKFLYLAKVICLFDGRVGATKNYIIRAIHDKQDVALKYEFTLGKWIYYKFFLAYIHLFLFLKKLLGNKLTSKVTRLLKNRKKTSR